MKKKQDSLFQKKANELLDKMSAQELINSQMKIVALTEHSLFIKPPQSVEDSYQFGWIRGIAFMTDSMFEGKWHAWLSANARGKADVNDIPKTNIKNDFVRGTLGQKMLDECMKILYNRGYRITDFIEWIGYALGIAWFKKPNLPEDIWKELYKTFNLDLFYMEPADYLSHFVAEQGQSGHLEYYPTPMNVTVMINAMLNTEGSNRTDSHFEPCIGGAALLLPSESVNLVGADLSLTMVKVAAIQAFIYKPWMLYVPKPLVGIHVDKDTLTINRYFEFNTDTRIYWGDSLLGEYRAPVHIFEQDSKLIDVFVTPLDLNKCEVLKYEEDMLEDWNSLSHDKKMAIVKAQARELPWQVITTNPPFNVRFNELERSKFKELELSNNAFLEERAMRLEKWEQSHSLVEAIIHEVELKITEKRANMLFGYLESI